MLEESISFHGAEIKVICETHDIAVETKLGSSARAECAFNYRPSLQRDFVF